MEGLRVKLLHSTVVLVVVADADNLTVAERIAVLDAKLVEASQPTRRSDEPIFFVIPRRNIETWIYYLVGDAVDEETDYKSRCTSSMVDNAVPAFQRLELGRARL